MISQPVSNGVIENSWRQAMMAGLHPILAAARAFGTTDLRADLAAFTIPTLIVHGTGDAIVPIDATSRAAAAPSRRRA
jgi:pimeloyl-ACP methyl ester carboxylesterase